MEATLYATPEVVLNDQSTCRALRKALVVGVSWPWLFHVEWVQQWQLHDSSKWNCSHTDTYRFSIRAHSFLDFGVLHTYYDGPHCTFSAGPFVVQWVPKGGWCEKCYNDR